VILFVEVDVADDGPAALELPGAIPTGWPYSTTSCRPWMAWNSPAN
jgi:hypothetical protein